MPTTKRRAAQGVRSPDKHQTPTFSAPMAALAVEALPEGPEWAYELKLDDSPYSLTVITRCIRHRSQFSTSVPKVMRNSDWENGTTIGSEGMPRHWAGVCGAVPLVC